MRKILVPLMTAVVVLGADGQAQQSAAPPDTVQPPGVTFRADVTLVEINAIVTDERGNFVKDLSKDDFEVYEDGKPQTPSVFALVDLPIERPFTPAYATQPIESDVRSTMRSFDGRLYVLVLDDLHTTTLRTQLVRDAARRFILEHFGANDLAAIVHSSGRDDAAQELTRSRARLLAAIDKFQGQKLPSATDERLAIHLRDEARGSGSSNGDSQSSSSGGGPVNDPFDVERGFNARRTLDLIKAVAEWMTDIHGRRKSLLLFSEGLDYDIYDVFNNRAATTVLTSAKDAIAAAQRANVGIYAIDPRGLVSATFDADVGSLPRDARAAQSVLGGIGRELLLTQESLIALADETGGLAVVRTNDIGGGLARVARENSTYYLLGYNTDPRRSPGRFRKIDVRVKRPGLQIRARRGYVPPDPKTVEKTREAEAKAGTSAALRAALNNPLPIGDVPMRVVAAPFKGTGRNASVLLTIEIDGAGLKFDEREGRFNEKLEVSVVAVDYHGKVRGSDRQTVDLKLKPDTHQVLSRAGGIRLLSRLDLPPSRYQIRVGVHESVGGGIGTVPYDLEVLDYAKSPFSLSGLVLTSSGATLMTTRPDPQLKDVLPSPPVASRVYHPDETIAFLVELYDNSTASSHEVDLVTTVRTANDGREVFNSRDARRIEEGNKGRTQGYQAEIPLKGLAPGTYVLRVEAHSRSTNQLAFREVPFEVDASMRRPLTN